MKKVYFIMSTDDFSGAESVNFSIINLLKKKYDFYWVSRSGKIDEFLKEKNIKHIIIEKLSPKELNRVIEEGKPDILHATDYRASCICALANTNIPIISHLHNNPPWIKGFFNKFSIMYLICSPKFSKILTVSESIQNEYAYSCFIKKKIKNVSNPVSVKMIRNKVNNFEKEYDICFCGRLTLQKDPLKFIEGIHKLKQKNKNIKVVMIGDGELRKDVEEKIKYYNLQNNIFLTGFIKNPYEYMAKAKVFVSTSLFEGYGLVAFEALALGLPIVVSNVGGLVGIVDEKSGFMYENNTFLWVEIVNELLNDQKKYEKYAKNAIIRAKELDNTEAYAEKIVEEYEKF